MEQVVDAPEALGRRFWTFITGKSLSLCGLWMQNVAAVVVVYDHYGSAFMAGLVSVAQFSAPLFISLLSGTLADRFSRRGLIGIGRGFCITSALALAAYAGNVAAGGTPPGWLPFVAVFVLGVGTSLSGPSMQAIVPDLVGDRNMERALRIGGVSQPLGRTVGPAVAALLLATLGARATFLAAALMHLALVVALISIGPQGRHSASERRASRGMRSIVRDRRLLVLFGGVALMSMAADPVLTLSPSLAAHRGTSVSAGLLVALFGAGSILGVGLMKPLRDRYSPLGVAGLGFGTLATGLCVAGVPGGVAWLPTGMVIQGVGFVCASVMLSVVIQSSVPRLSRGRAMAVWHFSFMGSRPLAATISGSLADLTSPFVPLYLWSVVAVLGGTGVVVLSKRLQPSPEQLLRSEEVV